VKITIESMAELVSELTREVGNIHDGTVRVRKISTPANEIVSEISYVVTALVADEDGSGYLLRFSEDCGSDVSPAADGTDTMAEGLDLLTEECDKIGLRIRPGEIEL